MVHMAADDRLDRRRERKRYETHENDPGDPGYRRFLNQLARPLLERLPAGACGLDYGSGPGPTLSVMLAEAGFPTMIYDPFFAPDESVLDRTYDFITCSEVIEHFFQPGEQFIRLDELLRPGGWLAVMTEVLREQRLADWRYARDETHVAFYRESTIAWISRNFGWDFVFVSPNVVMFRKDHVGRS